MRFSRFGFATTSLCALFLAAPPKTTQAQVSLLSNLDATPAVGTTLQADNGGSFVQRKAVAFTTGASSVSLTSFQAYLSLNDAGTFTTVTFGVYNPSTVGGSDPGSLVVSLGSKVVTDAVGSFTIYTYNPLSATTLSANTRYVVYSSSVTDASARWAAASPNVVPTARNSSGFNSVQYRISSDEGATFANSGVSNLFSINGILNNAAAGAPEPSTLPLVGMGIVSGLGVAGTARRQRNKAVKAA